MELLFTKKREIVEEEWEFGTEHDQFKMSWVFCETLGWLFGYVS